jgi:hypothetical protein
LLLISSSALFCLIGVTGKRFGIEENLEGIISDEDCKDPGGAACSVGCFSGLSSTVFDDDDSDRTTDLIG